MLVKLIKKSKPLAEFIICLAGAFLGLIGLIVLAVFLLLAFAPKH
jgi:hypothetical protein